jgi:DNA-binding transcriptional LysR family regulator
MDAGRIDFNRVAMFVHIAEAGGVTAAAAKLKLPKSSVSRGLTQLEGELGVELVLRGSRRFQLSEAGRTFFDAAAKGIAAVEDARDEVRDDRSVPHGRVRIAAPATFGTWLLAPVIATFVRRYPKVQVELCIRGRQVDPVREGFDLVLSVGRLADSSSRVRSLGTVDAAVYGSPTYLRERGTPQRPSDLARHECILYQSAGKKDRWALTGPTGTTVVVVDGHIRVDDLFTATATAANHGGLAVLPVHLPASDAGTLVRVMPDHVVRGEPAQLVYPASRHVPLRVSLLCDAIVAGASATCPSADGKLSAVAKQSASAARRREPTTRLADSKRCARMPGAAPAVP